MAAHRGLQKGGRREEDEGVAIGTGVCHPKGLLRLLGTPSISCKSKPRRRRLGYSTIAARSENTEGTTRGWLRTGREALARRVCLSDCMTLRSCG